MPPVTPPSGPSSQPRKVGAPPKLKDAMAAFVLAVANKSEEEITQLWVQEVQAWHDRNISYSATRLYVSMYKRAVADAYGSDHPAVDIVSLKTLSKLARLARQEAGPPEAEEAPAPKKSKAEHRLERAAGNIVGRKPKRLEAMVEFSQAIEYVDSEAGISAIWQKELAKYSEITDTTLKSYVSLYRKTIIERHQESNPELLELALSIVRLPDEISNRIRTEYTGRVVGQHRQLIGIARWREIAQKARELLNSSDPLRIGIGLLGVTGRRPIEIFTTAEFTQAPLAGSLERGQRSTSTGQFTRSATADNRGRAFEKWAVLFRGQAKTKGAIGSRYGEIYPIPVLAPAGEVIEALHRLRSSPRGVEWKGMHLDDFSRELRFPMRDLVPTLFGDLWPVYAPLTPKIFRPLYAEIAYKAFCTPGVSKLQYFAAILGHAADDLTSSQSYFEYYLVDEEHPEQDAAVAAAALKRAQKRIYDELQQQARAGHQWAREEAEDLAAWIAEKRSRGHLD